ncbi:hypothetical protein AB1Y20_019870 [Prymnesium parvum]|uniref:Hydroxyproline O-arabinosyltransferase-like domain-containing protein n=1 Tax=Prymnesium parvum TaxID=97485 RepID=A0AB34JX51_PRYPA
MRRRPGADDHSLPRRRFSSGDPNNGAAGLTGAFGFLLFCALLYYTTEFMLLSGYRADTRAHRLWNTLSSSLAQVEGRLEDAATEVEDGLGLLPHARLPVRLTPRPASADDPPPHPAAAEARVRLLPQDAPLRLEPRATPPAAAKALRGAEPAAADGSCPRVRRPYHVVMTAASGKYQEWQSRVMYYHYLKQKRLHPCSDMGGFTRLLNTHGAQPDSLMSEIPTLLVHQLKGGRCDECDHGFIVMNRPWGVLQLIESDHWRNSIPEEWVMLAETDHMIMAPPPNDATEERPVGFKFYYMTAMDPKLMPVVQKFLAPGIDPSTVDQAGPSPIIIHKPLLAKIARPWWDMSIRMKKDSDANRVFGWVLEMWGYNLAARNMGIRHLDWQDLQVEPQGSGTDDMDSKYIYHYTFGLHVDGPGGTAWSLDKRRYFGSYPSDHIELPPRCSSKSGFIYAGMLNEAAQNIAGWPTRDAPREQSAADVAPLARLRASTDAPPAGRGVGRLIVGTGPWRWGRIDSLYFFSRGIAYIAPTTPEKVGYLGRWSATGANSVTLRLCADVYELEFGGLDSTSEWTFRSLTAGVAPAGRLAEPPQLTRELLPHLRVPPSALGDDNASFVAEMAGSGPWRWAGSGPLAFLRGGVLRTPWGLGQWGVKRMAGGRWEVAAADQIFADFAGSFHTLAWSSRECLRLISTRKADGDRVPISFDGANDLTEKRCRLAMRAKLEE